MSERVQHRRKTWSLWEERRVPTEYEVVTHRFHYHFRRQPAPFELSPSWKLNQWYLRYREGSTFNVDDWEKFRDPYALTYRRYVETRQQREVYLDNLLDEFEARGHYRTLSAAYLDFLRDYYFPSRFSGHALQMTSAYIAQMAPSSYITNPFHFQTGDEMRRIQRTAYLAKAIAVDTGRDDLADSQLTRTTWETHPAWQPLRELIERHLVLYDWGEAFAVRNLVVKPAYDYLINEVLQRVARQHGDELLALLHDDFLRYDSRYSHDVTVALCRYAIERKPELTEWLRQRVAEWEPLAQRAIDALLEPYARASGLSAEELATALRDQRALLLQEAGIAP
jgi:toluene monooxygenase system protein E